MVKKKKENIQEILENLGRNTDELLVQKSLPLFSLWRSDLTLSEFKILDVYLSRINSHNEKMRTVRFEKGEIENLFGVKKINNSSLKERLKHLLTSVVEVQDIDDDQDIRLVTLFEMVNAKKDNFGQWQVELKCTEKALKYFFNIEKIGYLRYKLRSVVNISSRYAYIMFNYLEHNRYRKSWQIELDDLKVLLGCENEKIYNEFKEFNKKILKKSCDELNEKTECKFSYEPLKRGKKVYAIKFTLDTLSEKIYNNEFSKPIIPQNVNKIDERIEEYCENNLWADVLKNEFSFEELQEINEFLICVPLSKMVVPEHAKKDIQLCRYHYITQKLAKLESESKKKKISNRHKYLLKMISSDVG